MLKITRTAKHKKITMNCLFCGYQGPALIDSFIIQTKCSEAIIAGWTKVQSQ